MKRMLILLGGAAVVGFDQWLKHWTSRNLSFESHCPLINHVLSLTKVHNNGAAWSTFAGKQWFFYIVTLIALGILIPLLIRDFIHPTHLVYFTGLTLLLAGTIGNFIDRLQQGYVVDMLQLDFVNFPIFNLADSALTIGVILLFIFILFLDESGAQHG